MRRRVAFAVGLLLFCSCAPSAGGSDPGGADSAATADAAPPVDTKAVAANLVRAAAVAPGDRVLISGSPADQALLEDIAIEAMKVGGDPLITATRGSFARRSYDEVPESYDQHAGRVGMTIASGFEVAISVGGSDGSASALRGVAEARLARRQQAGANGFQLSLRRGVRSVDLGNGLTPRPDIAQALGITVPALATTFWAAAQVPADTLRAAAEPVRAALAGGGTVRITAPNGTDVTLAPGGNVVVSDGAISPEEVARGGSAVLTYLPAGEVLARVRPGSANGTVVVDKLMVRGTPVTGLKVTIANGRVTAMTATSGMEAVQAAYDAAGAGKDAVSWLDVGVNPAATFPAGTGHLVWVAPGAVTLGVGNDLGWGGSNAVAFGIELHLRDATLTVGDAVLIDKGALRR
jgi:leucyl aminopeptidase (aminopeptidase T)